jgi:hypothetical protein
MWARRTSGNGGGAWPTATVGDSKNARNSTAVRYRIPPTGIHAGNTLTDAVTLWPTPTASDGEKGGPGNVHGRGELKLSAAAARFPSPKARDYRTGGKPESRRMREKISGERHSPDLNDVAAPGGQLNPTWVEWLMGFPLGWTVCGDSETRWFRSLRGKRSRG